MDGPRVTTPTVGSRPSTPMASLKRDKAIATAARQRQTAFELERHAFEGNTLTQLFLILAKRKASWWKEAEDEQNQHQQNTHDATATSHGNTTIGGSPLGGANSTVALEQSAMSHGSPTSKTHRDEESFRTAGSIKGVAQSFSSDAERKKDMLQKRRALAAAVVAARKLAKKNRRDHPASILLQIPDTIVWENNIPKGWFFFDPKEQHVSRRKVETKQIQEAFLRDALFENDVVAVVYTVPHHQHSGDEESAGECLQYRYLTAGELPLFLFENRRGKGTSILQKFAYPLNIQHNDCIQVVWSPSVTQVNRRQNIHDIFDERVLPNDRCATFEGRTHLSRNVECTPRLQARIAAVCEELVKHFRETDSKHVINRLVLHVKITDTSDLVILYASSVRIVHAVIAASLPLSSGASLQIADPALNNVSQLQKRYRVSLELATKYSVKQVEDPSAAPSPQKKGSKSNSNDAVGQQGSPIQRRDSMMTKNVEMSATTVNQGQMGTAKQVRVVVQGRPATHHGFIMRDQSNNFGPESSSNFNYAASSSPSPSQPASPSKERAASRGSMMSMLMRSASNADKLSLIGIVQDVIRTEEMADASEVQRSRARHLLHAAMKRAGTTALRSALLQTRPNEALTEFERMELLALKITDLERRRMRRMSSVAPRSHTITVADARDVSSPSLSPKPSFAHVQSMDRFSKEGEDSSLSESLRLKKNAVFNGSLDAAIPAEIEDRWSEMCYSAQSYFDNVLVVPHSTTTDGFEFQLHLSDSADRAIYEWLTMRKHQSDAAAAVGHGILQSEGATLRFLLVDADSAIATFKVPPQVRAAQKIMHEAHEAMCSPDFAVMVRNARQTLPAVKPLLNPVAAVPDAPVDERDAPESNIEVKSEASHNEDDREYETVESPGVASALHPDGASEDQHLNADNM